MGNAEPIMHTATILFASDDTARAARAIRVTLTILGHYSVLEANSGEEALTLLRSESPDLALLDLNMPGAGGLETCRAIRETSDLPTIVLSARNTEREKVEALDAGADHYVTKPCGVQELLARIRAAVRRMPPAGDPAPEIFVSGDLEIDFARRRTILAGKCVHLTPKEHDVLRFLVKHPDRPVPHRKLLQAVWGPDHGDELEYLRVFINRLRQKIEPEPSNPKHLLTQPLVGYCFTTNG
jgi:two-component system KDP operon response regulator KdpE